MFFLQKNLFCGSTLSGLFLFDKLVVMAISFFRLSPACYYSLVFMYFCSETTNEFHYDSHTANKTLQISFMNILFHIVNMNNK